MQQHLDAFFHFGHGDVLHQAVAVVVAGGQVGAGQTRPGKPRAVGAAADGDDLRFVPGGTDGVQRPLRHFGVTVDDLPHVAVAVLDLDGDGPFSPERAGSLPTGDLVSLCFSGEYTEPQIRRMLAGGGGMVAYAGTSDMREVAKMAQEGNAKMAELIDAFHYQVGKEIGATAAAMHGKVDQIILTGGIAYGKKTVDAITDLVGWIAPITVYPGEDELLALAQGALRVLNGEEQVMKY